MQQLSTIVNSLKSKQFEQAIQQCQNALKTSNHPQLHLFLGIALGELGKIDEAEPLFNKLLLHFPKSLEIHFNYALILEKNKHNFEAIKHYESCLSLDNNNLVALRNISFLCYKEQNFKLALHYLDQLLQSISDDSFLFNLKGLVYMELKQTNHAIEYFNKALNLQPNEAEYLYNKATAQALSGIKSELEITLKKIALFDTDESLSFVASMYEKNNMLEEALTIIDKGLKKHPQSVDLLLTQAKVLKQQKLFQDALNTIDKISIFPNSEFKQEVLYEKASLYNKLQQHETAWQIATEANNESNEAWESTHTLKDNYNQVCNEINGSIDRMESTSIQTIDDPLNRNVAFILGFTRSGTTLIDSILSAHSDIEVLEEVPLIKDLTNQFPKSTPAAHFQQMLAATDEQKIQLRERYFEQIPKYLNISNAQLIIDKSPLNTSLIAFIKTVFPESKIIFSIRHPLDVLVSCYFQQFEFNSYMTNMVSTTKIAKTYDAILSVWKNSVEKFNIDVHYQRYEELVSCFEPQSKQLINYLGLEWQEQMAHFQSSLKSRAVIANPSYNQVTQPIYQTAKNRYKNHQSHLSEAIEILEPWIKYFDYKI